MISTEYRADTGIEEPGPWWRSPFALLVTVVGLLLATVLLIGGGSSGSGDQIDPVAAFRAYATTIETGDIDAILTGPALPGFDDVMLLEWMFALEAQPEFTTCWVMSQTADGTRVQCSVTMGPDYFYSRVLGENLATEVSGFVEPDGRVRLAGWPLPDGVAQAADAFLEWIGYVHPQDEERLFDRNEEAGLRHSAEAGLLHMQHLGDYLAYLADPSLRPEDVLQRLSVALGEAGPDYAGLEPAGFVLGFEGGEYFLPTQLALGMDPTFHDCEAIDGLLAACRVSMGETYLYSIISGTPVETTVRVQAPRDGTFQITGWPPTVEMWDAEYSLRSWIRSTYPELVEPMFGPSAGIFLFTEESAQLHMDVLDEYLADRDG